MRESKLTEKDMTVLREGDHAKVQSKKSHGSLRDYSLNHTVEVEWDLNEDAIRDKMFRLTVGDNTVICDAEEFMRYLRWV